MALNQINGIYTEASQAFVHTARDASGGKVEIGRTRAISPYFGRQDVAVTRDALQSLAQHRFGFGEAIIGRHVDKIDAEVERGMNRANAFAFVHVAKDATKWRRTV